VRTALVRAYEEANRPDCDVEVFVKTPLKQSGYAKHHETELQKKRVAARACSHADLMRVTYGDMARVRFCLCPLGIAPTTRRLFESVAAGCIPVVVADGLHVPFEETVDVDSVVVRVREKCAPWMPELLDAIEADTTSANGYAARVAALHGPAGQSLQYLGGTARHDAFHAIMRELKIKFASPESVAACTMHEKRVRMRTGVDNGR